MRKMFRKAEAGFTLIEMLIVVLIVGILAGVAAPVYFGYVKDAKTSDAKALAGSVFTALQACAQATPGTPCRVDSVWAKAGIPAGLTTDGRWSIVGSQANTLSMDNAGVWTVVGAPLVTVTGLADVAAYSVQFTYTAGPPAVSSFQCNTGSGLAAC